MSNYEPQVDDYVVIIEPLEHMWEKGTVVEIVENTYARVKMQPHGKIMIFHKAHLRKATRDIFNA